MRTLDEFFNGKVPEVTKEDTIESLYRFGHITKKERTELYNLNSSTKDRKGLCISRFNPMNLKYGKLKNRKVSLKK